MNSINDLLVTVDMIGGFNNQSCNSAPDISAELGGIEEAGIKTCNNTLFT